jgi:hypothetical protein
MGKKMNETLPGRLILCPDICPLGSFQEETVYYLSWPAWEFCLNPPPNTKAPALYKIFPSLKRPDKSECLMIDEPPNFLNSLSSLRAAMTKGDLESVLRGLPYDREDEFTLKTQIKKGTSEKVEGHSMGYLTLSLYTIAMMEEAEIHSIMKEAEKRNRDMLSRLIGPDGPKVDLENPEADDLSNDPSTLGVDFLENSHPETAQGKVFSEKLAKGIINAWFKLASGVLHENDRLFTDSEQFQEILTTKYIKVPNKNGQFYYHEHNL